jgi:hypothetical protein
MWHGYWVWAYLMPGCCHWSRDIPRLSEPFLRRGPASRNGGQAGCHLSFEQALLVNNRVSVSRISGHRYHPYQKKFSISETVTCLFRSAKSIMVSKDTSGYVLRAKTGWSRQDNGDIGWCVGDVETAHNAYYFANCVQIDDPEHSEFGLARVELHAILEGLDTAKH